MVETLDVQFISKELDGWGGTVTLRTVTDASHSKWGDATETTSDETGVTAVFNIITQITEFEKETIFHPGDIVFFFKGDQANLDRGNRIQYNSVWYEIDEPIEHSMDGTTYLQTVKVKKI